MVEYIPTYHYQVDQLVEQLKQRKIHVVFMAINALTYLNAIATHSLGFTSAELDVHVNKVNLQKETGTLFPKANVTLLPNNLYNDDSIEFDEIQIETFISDVFEANRLYIKSDTIFFLLDAHYIYHNQIIRVLERMIQQKAFVDPYVRTIYSNGLMEY